MQAVRTSFLSLTETGAAQFSVSDTGALVYVPGVTAPEKLNSLVWVSRNGTVTPTKVTTVPYAGPRLSPDGQRVLLGSLSRGTRIHDLARGGLVPVAPGFWSTFTPDGKQITVSEPSGFVSMSIEGRVTDHFAIDGPVRPMFRDRGRPTVRRSCSPSWLRTASGRSARSHAREATGRYIRPVTP